ncbi:MAG: nuclear transport factor 2 family protein [Bryobacteraceae bacterium]
MLLGQTPDPRDAERYITEGEHQWAATLVTGDTSTVQRLLADDFLGVDPDGDPYDKPKQIADTRGFPKTYVSNRLNEMKVRFFWNAAVIQGSETWERRTGTPKRGRFVWTDTWIFRNGKWQIVAAEDLIAPVLPSVKE